MPNRLLLNRLLVISGLLILVHCKSQPAEQASQSDTQNSNTVTLTGAQLKNAPVETTQLSKNNIATVLKLYGKIDLPPQKLVSVSMPLGGYLKSTYLVPGMQVKKGQVIAVMEDPQYVRLQQEYLQAKSELKFAELDYNRQKELNQSQANSNKILQQAEAKMNNLRIVMNAVAQQLRLININPDKLDENAISKSVPVYSGVNGFVSNVFVNIGKYVNPADVLFELVDPSDIHLNLKVYENDINKLSIGQKLTAYSNAQPGKKYEGKIILINKDIGNNAVSEVHCHFLQYDNNLLPGMYMNAEVEIHASTASTIPEESVVNFEGKDYVFVQQGQNEFKMTPVNLGEKGDGFIQVLNDTGFSGKNIVTKNAYTLLMKLKNTSDEE